jgi:hypothetical protein
MTVSVNETLDFVSDLLGEAIFSVDSKHYKDLTDEQKDQVKQTFFRMLDAENINVTRILIEQAASIFVNSPLDSLLQEYKNLKSEFYPALQSIQPGQKITIVKFSEFGFPIHFQTTVHSITIKPYAQYEETLYILHRPKRKRSLYGTRICPYESFFVYDGWIDIDMDNIMHNTSKTDSATIKTTRYVSFNRGFLHDVLSIIDKEPLYRYKI